MLEGNDFHAPIVELVPLAFAYLLFIAGAACGIVASFIGNTLTAYGEIGVQMLRQWSEQWQSTATADMAQLVAMEQISLLGRLRGQNFTKWRLLQAGVLAQLSGMGVFLIVLAMLILRPQT